MNGKMALLTFSLGPVHTFIAQARRLADLWAGSQVLSRLIEAAIDELWRQGGQLVFPDVPKPVAPAGSALGAAAFPAGLPNRFVCRVERDRAAATAVAMRDRVLAEWDEMVVGAVDCLRPVGLAPQTPIHWSKSPDGRPRQTDHVLDIAWSWTEETGDYEKDSHHAGARFAASRLFRPFAPACEEGQKCAICGERTALPNGDSERVDAAWRAAEGKSGAFQVFFRAKQGRLCLVCATKRLFPALCKREPTFEAIEAFQPSEDDPYFAVVCLDGDRMGHLLAAAPAGIRLEIMQRGISKVLSKFAGDLRGDDRNLAKLGLASLRAHLGSHAVATGNRHPQLIYAGGDDVLLVCTPSDALPLARAIQAKYRQDFATMFDDLGVPQDRRPAATMSAAVVFAHTHAPAGQVFRDAEILLAGTAKEALGRDAIAVRLDKRSGEALQFGFRWQEKPRDGGGTWIEAFDDLTQHIKDGGISSSQSYALTRNARHLHGVLTEKEWTQWLCEQLSRGEGSAQRKEDLDDLLAPFFIHRKTAALRIARFLASEVGA